MTSVCRAGVAWAAVAAMLGAWAAPAEVRGAIRSEAVEYKEGQTVLAGHWVWDDAKEGPRPAVLVVHEWWGLNDYAKGRARQLAEMGYAAFAVDMYGKGQRATTREQAGKLAGGLKGDRALMRRRIGAAFELVRADKRVDAKRVAAIGYCFGGTVVLELARSGAEVAAVVSFHGSLDTPSPEDAKNIKASVLVCTGADDKAVPMSQIADFVQEMRGGKVDYQVVIYGNAVHTFTNPAAGSDPSTNSAYDAKADRRSWALMKDFLAETLADK